jgi:hypothetical protein
LRTVFSRFFGLLNKGRLNEPTLSAVAPTASLTAEKTFAHAFGYRRHPVYYYHPQTDFLDLPSDEAK